GGGRTAGAEKVEGVAFGTNIDTREPSLRQIRSTKSPGLHTSQIQRLQGGGGQRFPAPARVHPCRRRCWKPLPATSKCRLNFRLVSKSHDLAPSSWLIFCFAPEAIT